MHKQLINLGIQAGLMTGEKEQLFFCRPITQFDEYSPEIEKFAELIVQECVEYCGENLSRTVAGALKIHFGIEP